MLSRGKMKQPGESWIKETQRTALTSGTEQGLSCWKFPVCTFWCFLLECGLPGMVEESQTWHLWLRVDPAQGKYPGPGLSLLNQKTNRPNSKVRLCISFPQMIHICRKLNWLVFLPSLIWFFGSIWKHLHRKCKCSAPVRPLSLLQAIPRGASNLSRLITNTSHQGVTTEWNAELPSPGSSPLKEKVSAWGQLSHGFFLAVRPVEGTDSFQGAEWVAEMMSNSFLSGRWAILWLTEGMSWHWEAGGWGCPLTGGTLSQCQVKGQEESSQLPQFIKLVHSEAQFWAWRSWGFPCLGERSDSALWLISFLSSWL